MAAELTTDLAILERLAEPDGKDVVDIGCGPGALVRALTGRGARVVGIEISEQQLAAAIAHDDRNGARYLVGRAEALPLEPESVDVAIFMRSLHHVPPGRLTPALGEARRVLRAGGSIYVAEPLAHGDYFVLTSIVEDEREARRAAQQAIADAVLAGLERVTTVDYDVRVCLRDLDAFRARLVNVDLARAALFDERRAEIGELFERSGEPGEHPSERCFTVSMRADVLRAAAG